jgi:hypothetical protein
MLRTRTGGEGGTGGCQVQGSEPADSDDGRGAAQGEAKAEPVRDRLEGLDRLMGSYPEGHDMRARLEELHTERALEAVEEDVRRLMDAIQRPRGT